MTTIHISLTVSILFLLMSIAILTLHMIYLRDSTHSPIGPVFSCLFLSVIFSLSSFIKIHKVEKIEYLDPSSIIKTNGLTHIVYIHNNTVYNETYDEAIYWIATNIKIKVSNGKNIWGRNAPQTNYKVEICN